MSAFSEFFKKAHDAFNGIRGGWTGDHWKQIWHSRTELSRADRIIDIIISMLTNTLIPGVNSFFLGRDGDVVYSKNNVCVHETDAKAVRNNTPHNLKIKYLGRGRGSLSGISYSPLPVRRSHGLNFDPSVASQLDLA